MAQLVHLVEGIFWFHLAVLGVDLFLLVTIGPAQAPPPPVPLWSLHAAILAGAITGSLALAALAVRRVQRGGRWGWCAVRMTLGGAGLLVLMHLAATRAI